MSNASSAQQPGHMRAIRAHRILMSATNAVFLIRTP